MLDSLVKIVEMQPLKLSISRGFVIAILVSYVSCLISILSSNKLLNNFNL